MGIFKHIFKKKEPLVPFNLSFLGNDLHSHLIPGIDDGAKTMEDSLFLARGLVDLGYKKVITTPHIMSDYYKNSPTIISEALSNLNIALAKNEISLTVEAAAEYYVDFDFIEKIGKEELLTFGDNHILIECSFIEPPREFKESLFRLQTNGYKPILAHPERYQYWHKNLKFYEELKDRDILFQVNMLSLIGIYSPQVTAVSEYLIKNKMVEVLGTDLHNQYQLSQLKHIRLKQEVINNISELTLLNSSL